MGINAPLNRKLRMGLVGGGQGAFIGRVHATAAVLDNRAVLVAGALSSEPAKAKSSAPDYDIKPERAYGSFSDMVAAESKLPASERIDFVSIATPNHTHFEIAKAFAEAGFNVMCDKPMTFDLAQAEQLAEVVKRTGVVFGVTHNYTGYPLVRQARDMVLSGQLGEINAVRAVYAQMWLRVNGEPHRLYTRDPNAPFTTETARNSCRLPSGHPEAFLEAFANVYTAAYNDMVARAAGKSFDAARSLYPNVADGVDGMNF